MLTVRSKERIARDSFPLAAVHYGVTLDADPRLGMVFEFSAGSTKFVECNTFQWQRVNRVPAGRLWWFWHDNFRDDSEPCKFEQAESPLLPTMYADETIPGDARMNDLSYGMLRNAGVILYGVARGHSNGESRFFEESVSFFDSLRAADRSGQYTLMQRTFGGYPGIPCTVRPASERRWRIQLVANTAWVQGATKQDALDSLRVADHVRFVSITEVTDD